MRTSWDEFGDRRNATIRPVLSFLHAKLAYSWKRELRVNERICFRGSSGILAV